MDTIDLISNNNFILKTTTNISTDVIIFSLPNIKTNMDDYVKEFINVKSFPYVNTEYGYLLEESISQLDDANKIELREILIKYSTEIEKAVEKHIVNNEESALLTEEQKINYLESVKGGQYAEMLLMNILISLGYQKILSKLYLEIGEGRPTPTLIDVPCIKNKSLVLGECKLFANIDDAIKNVVKDIDNIVSQSKFDKEIKEWKMKFKQVPESVRNHLLCLKILDGKDTFVDNLEEVVVVGFVMGKHNIVKIKEQLDKHPLPSSSNLKYKICLIMVPLDDKKAFIYSCYKAISGIVV